MFLLLLWISYCDGEGKMIIDVFGKIMIDDVKDLRKLDKIQKQFNKKILKFAFDGGIWFSQRSSDIKKDTCEFCGKTRPALGKDTKNTDFNYAVHMCDDCYCARTYATKEEQRAYLKAIGRTSFEPIPSIVEFHRER